MPSKLAEDPRIDPRIKAVFADWDVRALGDVATREDLLAVENSDTGKAAAAAALGAGRTSHVRLSPA